MKPDSKNRQSIIRRSQLKIQPLDEQARTPATVKETLVRHRRPVSSFTLSLAAHLILLLTFLLIVFGDDSRSPISLEASLTSTPSIEKTSSSSVVEIEIPTDSESPTDSNFQSFSQTVSEDPEVAENPLAVMKSTESASTVETATIPIPSAPIRTYPTGGGLSGRDSATRAHLAATQGGTKASEDAVARGLKWILEHQQEDGSWRLHHHKGPCDGRCPNEGSAESTTAATGLALMALLGAGYTHQTGPYQEPIHRGIRFLIDKVRDTPHGGIVSDGQKRMYSQAIATIAMAEAYNMTGDSRLAEPVEACRRYIVAAQHSQGSWGYNAGSRGDITVTGWQLMALKSCQMAGFSTEPLIWQKAQNFLDALLGSNGSFGYRNDSDGNLTTSSIGLLSNMILGMHKEHATLTMGADVIGAAEFSKTNVYYNYYATQVLHHLQNFDWKKWNPELRDYLVATQVGDQSHADGSWYFPDEHGRVGGRLYTTAMCVMILEVYYRYLPLYRHDTFSTPPGVPVD